MVRHHPGFMAQKATRYLLGISRREISLYDPPSCCVAEYMGWHRFVNAALSHGFSKMMNDCRR